MMKLRKKKDMNNFDFCYGMAANWCSLEEGKMYHIQEYREAIDRGEHPEGIRVSVWNDPEQKTVEIVNEYVLRQRMKDPEPDPRY